MMKNFIKGLTYTYIAIAVAQFLLGTFSYMDKKSYWLIIIAFTLLNIFKTPMLDIVSLATRGPLFYIFTAFLSVILLNVLVAIMPDFEFMPSTLPSFNLFGFVVGSTYLSPFLSGVCAAVTISLVSNYLYWLSAKK